MSIGLIDLIIIIIIALGGIVGFKNGAIKEGTKFLGLFIIIIVSFLLKDRLMVAMYENLPFFNFFGLIKGLDAINILFYQLISFLVIFIALLFLLKVLVVLTGLVEVLVKMTVFLSLPSKILGAIIGAIEFYVYIFIILFVLNMPIFNLSYVNDSMIGNKILKDTPVLSNLVNNTVEVYSDVWNIIKNRDKKENKEINTLVLASLLDHKLITIESAKKLVETNKIILSDETILDNYNENNIFKEELKEKYLQKNKN